MLIDFEKITEQLKSNVMGGEKEYRVKRFVDADVKIMHGVLVPGGTIGMHTHEGSCEVIYILSGEGKMLCDGVYEPLHAGSCTYCPEGHTHSLINGSAAELEFLAVVPTKS